MPYNGYGGYTNTPFSGYNNGYTPTYNPMPQMQPQMPNMGQMPQAQPNQVAQPQQLIQAQQQPQMAQMAQAPLRSNRTLVTSYEEALTRPTDFNSEMLYFHQSEPFIFQIYTDMQGKKTPYIYKFTECSIEDMQADIKGVKPDDLMGYATKDDLTKLENKFADIIKQLMPSMPKKREKTVKENEITEGEE